MQLAQDGRFPKIDKSHWKTVETIQGIIDHYRDLAREKSSDEEQEKNVRLKNQLLEKELAEIDRQLIPVATVETAWAFIITNTRQRILHHAKLSEEIKRELLSELKEIPVAEYVEPKT